MANSQIKNLFHLIKSLSKSEKAYFRKQSTVYGNEDKIYLLIFNTLEKQKELANLDFSKLEFQFKNVAQFSERANYLKAQILSSLRNQIQPSPRTQFNDYIKNIEILIEKALYEQALNELNRAKKFGVKYEVFEGLLSLANLERYLLSLAKPKYHLERAQEIQDEYMQLCDKITEIYKRITFHKTLINFVQLLPDIESEEVKATFEQIKRDPLNQNSFKPTSVRSKLLSIHLKTLISKVQIEALDLFNNCEQIAEIYKEQPQMKKYLTVTYFSSLINYFNATFHFKKWKKMDSLYLELEKSSKANPHTDLVFLKRTYSTMARYWGAIKPNQSKLEKAILDYNKRFKNYGHFLSKPDLKEYYFANALAYAYLENWSKALDQINLCIETKTRLRPDITISARLFYLLAYYEITPKVDKHLKETSRSLYKYLHKSDFSHPVELEFTNFFYRLKEDENEQKKQFSDLKDRLKKLSLDSWQKYKLEDHFDFMGWIDKHIKTE